MPASLLAPPFTAACLVDADAGRWLGGVAAVLLVGAAAVARSVRRRGPAAPDRPRRLKLRFLPRPPPMLMLANGVCPPHWSGSAYGAVGVTGALLATVLLGPLVVALYRRLRWRINGIAPGTPRRAIAALLAVFGECALWSSAETARNDWAETRARRALATLPAES